MSERTSLADVCREATTEAQGKEKPEGVWINGDLDLVVKRGNPPQGNKPSKASAYDEKTGQEATLVWFGGDLSRYDGAIVRVSGKGNKAKLYRGNVEINVGKNGTVQKVGETNVAPPPPNTQSAPKAGDPLPPTVAKPKVDPVTYFHRQLSKGALLYAHAYQYARDMEKGLGITLAEPQFQAAVSSLFIKADRDGLGEKVPALREKNTDEKIRKIFTPYVPPAPDPAVLEAEKARLAAAEEAKRKAEEAEKAAAAARAAASTPHHVQQENLDEDVPF